MSKTIFNFDLLTSLIDWHNLLVMTRFLQSLVETNGLGSSKSRGCYSNCQSRQLHDSTPSRLESRFQGACESQISVSGLFGNLYFQCFFRLNTEDSAFEYVSVSRYLFPSWFLQSSFLVSLKSPNFMELSNDEMGFRDTGLDARYDWLLFQGSEMIGCSKSTNSGRLCH
jgi:hypothetical protein